jgi:hypothetical protein
MSMRNPLRSVVRLCVALGIATLPLAGHGLQAAEPRNSEQIVFSGTGGDFGGNGPFGFWIWCEADSANPYVGVCRGAMYFYALGLTKSVQGAVVELAEGDYKMLVTSVDHTITCSLENLPPAQRGPTNTVYVNCTAPSGDGSSSSAVVNVTGPPSGN